MTRRAVFAGVAALAAQTLPPDLERRLAPPGTPVPAVVDSDAYNEIDDQFAVSYALLSPATLNVEAVYAAPFLNERSTSPAHGMARSYEEILRIFERLKRSPDGMVERGSERFMPGAGQAVESPAARDLVKRALQRPGPLYVITIGAPTNVSSALLMEPRIRDRIVVVWLGGQPYDSPSAREFNLYQDIHASRVLYDSGVALVNIPTRNVAEHLRTSVPEIEHHLRGGAAIAEYLAKEFRAYAEWKSPRKGYPLTRVIWDISAVAWLVNPKWVPTKVVPSPVLRDGFTWETRPGRHPVRVATGCDRDAILDDLFTKLRKG